MMTTTATLSIDERPRLTRRRFWLSITLVVFGVMAIAIIAFYFGYVRDVPLQIASETTYIIEPLTDDGTRVDYFAAAEQMVYPPEMATEDNGYRMIIEALGVGEDTSPELARQIYEKLGLDPATPDTLAYIQPYDFLNQFLEAEVAAGRVAAGNDRQWLENEIYDQLDRAWTLDDLPMFEDWLNENGPALDLVAEAVQKPSFCMPRVRSSGDVPLIALEFNGHRFFRIARGFATRARFRMATGDIDGAIDDVIACARLGRLQQGSLDEHLLGIACESLAYSVGLGLSLEHQPTEEQWRRYLRELDSLPAAEAITAPLETERLVCLDAIQSLAIDGHIPIIDTLIGAGPSRPGEVNWSMGMRGFDKHEGIDLNGLLAGRDYGLDWNIVMQQVNERFDELLRNPYVAPPLAPDVDDFMPRAERSQVVGDQLFLQFQTAIAELREGRQRLDCKDDLHRIVIAMLLYEKQHGTLPPAYSVDEQGKPLHSWRVLLLPYLGYDELYSQLRLDEPWDSTHNQAFHTADVPIYQCPTAALGPGLTSYTVVVGATCPFNGSEGKRLDAFGSLSADMILVAERRGSVYWMDPTRELSFADACAGINRTPIGLGSEHEGRVHAGMRSGAVKVISESIDYRYIPRLLEGTMDKSY